jgi:hypothetical protein
METNNDTMLCAVWNNEGTWLTLGDEPDGLIRTSTILKLSQNKEISEPIFPLQICYPGGSEIIDAIH